MGLGPVRHSCGWDQASSRSYRVSPIAHLPRTGCWQARPAMATLSRRLERRDGETPVGGPGMVSAGSRVWTAIAEARYTSLCAEGRPQRGLTCRPLPVAPTAVLGPQRLRSPARAHIPWTRRVAESTRDCDLPRIALPGAVMATRFRVFRIAAILHLVTRTYKLSHEFDLHRHRCVGERRTSASWRLDRAWRREARMRSGPSQAHAVHRVQNSPVDVFAPNVRRSAQRSLQGVPRLSSPDRGLPRS
jgi:hypothetical protein